MNSKAPHRPSYRQTGIVKPKNIWSFMKAFAFVAFSVVSIGSMICTVSVSRGLQLQINSLLKKNDILSNRFKRSDMIISQMEQRSGENIRVKRAPGDNDSEGEQEIPIITSLGAGVTYTRWGRRDCSGPHNELIYDGIAAGSWYSHTGGASNHLCLHMNVTYTPGKYRDGQQGNAYIYGMEYRDSGWVNNLLDLSLTEGALQYHSVPCAICLARSRINQLMIPGREKCPEGWTLEYTGYIMSGGHNDKHSSNAICVDESPQVVPGTQGNQNGAYLFMVEASCTSLLCEPFVTVRELRCVVCTI